MMEIATGFRLPLIVTLVLAIGDDEGSRVTKMKNEKRKVKNARWQDMGWQPMARLLL